MSYCAHAWAKRTGTSLHSWNLRFAILLFTEKYFLYNEWLYSDEKSIFKKIIEKSGKWCEFIERLFKTMHFLLGTRNRDSIGLSASWVRILTNEFTGNINWLDYAWFMNEMRTSGRIPIAIFQKHVRMCHFNCAKVSRDFFMNGQPLCIMELHYCGWVNAWDTSKKGEEWEKGLYNH